MCQKFGELLPQPPENPSCFRWSLPFGWSINLEMHCYLSWLGERLPCPSISEVEFSRMMEVRAKVLGARKRKN